MPTYSFRNKDTMEEFEENMKIAEKEEYLKNHPEIEQIFTKVNIVDPMAIGVLKPPSDFQKGVIGRMKAALPKNNIGKYSRWSIPKEI